MYSNEVNKWVEHAKNEALLFEVCYKEVYSNKLNKRIEHENEVYLFEVC